MKYFLLFSLFICLTASAEMYKWIDANGKIHYSDKPPTTQEAELIDEQELATKISSYDHVSVKLLDVNFDYETRKSIIMYSTKWCGYCAKARNYFQKNDINYVEKDIEKSSQAKSEYVELGGRGVPVILIDKYRMNGFNEQRFKKLYSKE